MHIELNIYTFSIVLISKRWELPIVFACFFPVLSRYFVRVGSVVTALCLDHPSQAPVLEDEVSVVCHGLGKEATL